MGYAAAAVESFRTFTRLEHAGEIPAGIRFQVSLPTPVAVVAVFVRPEDRARAEQIYLAALRRELAAITTAIPAEQLAIQWDVAVEFAILEGAGLDPWFADPTASVVRRLVELGDLVPDAVELGYHLCYGDAGHRHFVEPKDTSLLVEIANYVVAGVSREVHFLHLPVPRGRNDRSYFAPLAELRLHDATQLYLGLVHLTDGVDGALARAAAARQVIGGFGVATECGFGRRPAETVEPLLELHSAVLEAVRIGR